MCLKNYGKVKDQVELAIKHCETSEIFYFGGWSRFHVHQWQECIDYCKQALSINPDHKQVKSIMNLALNEKLKENKKMNEMSMISKLEKAKKQKIFKEVQKHGIKIGKQLHYMPEDIGASLYIDDFGDLHFPIIIQYDEFMQ